MHRGQVALEEAERAWQERAQRQRNAIGWYLRGLGRRYRARLYQHTNPDTAMNLDMLATDAFSAMKDELRQLDPLYEKARAFEIKSRIAFEEGEERYAEASDEVWIKLAQSARTP